MQVTWTPAEFHVNYDALAHSTNYTLGKAVEQLARCLAKQAAKQVKVQRHARQVRRVKMSYEYLT